MTSKMQIFEPGQFSGRLHPPSCNSFYCGRFKCPTFFKPWFPQLTVAASPCPMSARIIMGTKLINVLNHTEHLAQRLWVLQASKLASTFRRWAWSTRQPSGAGRCHSAGTLQNNGGSSRATTGSRLAHLSGPYYKLFSMTIEAFLN